jgi:quercetin dioxygenase-like cupin family protein
MRFAAYSLVCLGSAALLAQDVMTVAPAGMVKVEYEDAQMRVLRFTEGPGAKLPMHSHAGPYVAVGLSNDVARYTFPDGKTTETKTRAGEVEFSKPVTHASQNIGKTAGEAVLVELKTKPAGTVLTGAGDMVKANPGNCKVELDNEYVRVTRVKLPARGKLAMHTHPSANVVVFLTGGRTKATAADGKSEETNVMPGTVRSSPPGSHSNENLSDKPTEAVLIELKTAAR